MHYLERINQTQPWLCYLKCKCVSAFAHCTLNPRSLMHVGFWTPSTPASWCVVRWHMLVYCTLTVNVRNSVCTAYSTLLIRMWFDGVVCSLLRGDSISYPEQPIPHPGLLGIVMRCRYWTEPLPFSVHCPTQPYFYAIIEISSPEARWWVMWAEVEWWMRTALTMRRDVSLSSENETCRLKLFLLDYI